MLSFRCYTLSFVMAWMVCGSLKATAQTIIATNTTINYSISGDVYVKNGAASTYVKVVTGGSVSGFLTPRDTSIVTVADGAISCAEADNASAFNVTGGSISRFLNSYDSSTVRITGGTIGYGGAADDYIQVQDNSTVSISGGAVKGYVYAYHKGIVNYSGGRIEGDLFATGKSVFNVYGSDLQLLDPTPSGSGMQYTLTGKLADGTVLDKAAFTFDSGKFVLHSAAAPAPGAFLTTLLGATPGVYILLRRRRKTG